MIDDERDQTGDARDRAGERRDQAGDQRDEAAARRDQAADARDEAAQHRDESAERAEASADPEPTTDALNRSTQARRHAASDRRRASEDRLAGASERTEAELDRDIALADRGASAKEREYASVDDLTGAHVRRAGFVVLEGEIARARRTRQPLVLAFVDVDDLRSINESRGHPAGDRLLLEVANTLRAELRSFDLIIRYGDHEFVCAISGLTAAGATKRFALVNAVLAEAPEGGSITVGFAELQPDDSPEDLVARADAALDRERRQRGGSAVVEVWEVGDLVVDERTRSVSRAGSPIQLTATELKVLVMLVRDRSRVVTKHQLFGEVWGYDADDHLLEVHMSSLRHKLEAHGPRMIQTVRGTGYVLRP